MKGFCYAFVGNCKKWMQEVQTNQKHRHELHFNKQKSDTAFQTYKPEGKCQHLFYLNIEFFLTRLIPFNQ